MPASSLLACNYFYTTDVCWPKKEVLPPGQFACMVVWISGVKTCNYTMIIAMDTPVHGSVVAFPFLVSQNLMMALPFHSKLWLGCPRYLIKSNMLDTWFLLLLFLNLASHYLLIGLGSFCGPEPVTKAVEGQLSKCRAFLLYFFPRLSAISPCWTGERCPSCGSSHFRGVQAELSGSLSWYERC